MLRRLVAALLALAIAVPLPALASGCSMDDPMIAAGKCDCCTSPATMPASGGCASATVASGCGCTLRADTGSQPSSTATTASTTVSFAIDVALIPAELSTPRRPLRDIELAASPPGAGAVVSRPSLCSWII